MWKAWLSTTTANAIDRIAEVGPWFLAHGATKLFANKAQFAIAPSHAIDLDEAGSAVQPPLAVWTGTLSSGKAGLTCADWTMGLAKATWGSTGAISGWTDVGADATSQECEGGLHLYCVEQ